MSNDNKNTEDRTPGVVSWNELVSRDVSASKRFDAELLGWTTEEMPMPAGTCTLFKLGERPVAGLLEMPPEVGEAPVMWMGYITVSDVKAALEKARSLGATVCKDVTNLSMGSFAVVTGPQGATFGLWEFASGTCDG